MHYFKTYLYKPLQKYQLHRSNKDILCRLNFNQYFYKEEGHEGFIFLKLKLLSFKMNLSKIMLKNRCIAITEEIYEEFVVDFHVRAKLYVCWDHTF